MAQVVCYDGVGCIGGNKILLEDGKSRLFFDFGKNFGLENLYYEEFIQPKTMLGLYEPIQMGLLPPFTDLYREDLASQLCDPWLEIEKKEIGDVGGVLVSHAHVDHIGAIHFLRPDIPIYCSPMTATLSRVLQDVGAGPTAAEYCYYVGRADNDGLSTPHWKNHPHKGRQYHLTDAPGQDFKEFWNNTPDARELEPVEYGQASRCAGLKVRSFPVDHSLYGAVAWAVETSAGWVVYAGDLRLHGGYGDFSRQFAEQAAELDPIALILEGTRIRSKGNHTEASVKTACYEVVKGCSGLVVADFGPRNVERLASFLEIARQTGRKLAILPKDAYMLDAMQVAGSPQSTPQVGSGDIVIYCEYSSGSKKWKQQVLDKYQNLCLSTEQLRANQDKYICCLGFWDINELAYIRPVEGSVWISSNCEAFNEEMVIDEKRLRNWLDKFGMEFVGGETEHGNPFHVSGHASGQDLRQIVETIRPEALIPVHTEEPELFVEIMGDLCEVRIPETGVAIGL